MPGNAQLLLLPSARWWPFLKRGACTSLSRRQWKFCQERPLPMFMWHRQMLGSLLWWGVPALFGTIELGLSTCLQDLLAAGLQLKHFTLTWQFLTRNALICNSWLRSLHLVPPCNSCTFQPWGGGCPGSPKAQQPLQSRFPNATLCPCRQLCRGRLSPARCGSGVHFCCLAVTSRGSLA